MNVMGTLDPVLELRIAKILIRLLNKRLRGTHQGQRIHSGMADLMVGPDTGTQNTPHFFIWKIL